MTASAHEIIAEFNTGRDPERLAMKLEAMAADPFPFLRGTCHLFYQRLVENKLATGGPPAWICGDLHLENFGTYLGDTGLVYFDINDFDEAALAPVTWDILRLVTSLYVAAPGLGLSNADRDELAADMTETWRTELAAGKPRWIERKTADGIIGALMDDLKTRRPSKFLDKRTVLKKGTRRLIADEGKALPLSGDDRAQLGAFCDALGAETRQAKYFRFIDGARRIAGTGSLGIPRFIILIEGEGSPDGNVLLDLKEARATDVATYARQAEPNWQSPAHRVVTIMGLCQAVAPGFLKPVTFAGKPYVVRELQPTADRLNLANATRNMAEFREAVLIMAKLAAWAELRATGRQGSATADALIAYAKDPAVSASVLASARAMATITQADWEEYAGAYKAGRKSQPEKPRREARAS